MDWYKPVFLTITLTVIMLFSFNPLNFQPKTMTEVIVEVVYDNQWMGTINNGDETLSWQAMGTFSETIIRPVNEDKWRISVSAQKMDESTDILIIKLMKRDGEVLIEKSTSTMNGVVAFSVTYQ